MRWFARSAVLAVMALACAALAAFPVPAWHAGDEPPDLAALQAMQPAPGQGAPFAAEKRTDAMRLAALGFGARAGLARRGWEIVAMLERHAETLDAIYRFAPLMLTEAGFTVLPPVLAETRRAFRLERSGRQAARADRILRIVEPARLVSAAPDWRDWLGRSWPEPVPPAGVLFPRDGEERARWRRLLAEGWAEGRELADDIFAADLDRLNRVFEGAVLWHRLHRAGMVSAPRVAIMESGVSGHERMMRLRAASAGIADGARFELDAVRWTGELPGTGKLPGTPPAEGGR
ncbi:MAG: type IV secretory system conjugative DNA transfer family protein [Rhodospirillales bacterium]|nr:type IV secretory system conjugative DNA transfer family protein [Rhodospirillales bacterium]MDE0378491.1 type IV secretory system conjugative DNA transfer family protein [Rhodospirillales bacterium]